MWYHNKVKFIYEKIIVGGALHYKWGMGYKKPLKNSKKGIFCSIIMNKRMDQRTDMTT